MEENAAGNGIGMNTIRAHSVFHKLVPMSYNFLGE